MTSKKLWIGFISVMTITLGVLLCFGREIDREAPPIPDKIVTENGDILFTGQDIKDRQNIWQSIGGQELAMSHWRYNLCCRHSGLGLVCLWINEEEHQKN